MGTVTFGKFLGGPFFKSPRAGFFRSDGGRFREELRFFLMVPQGASLSERFRKCVVLAADNSLGCPQPRLLCMDSKKKTRGEEG
jgi:hypothetical protein